jgi:hypothetical protein
LSASPSTRAPCASSTAPPTALTLTGSFSSGTWSLVAVVAVVGTGERPSTSIVSS